MEDFSLCSVRHNCLVLLTTAKSLPRAIMPRRILRYGYRKHERSLRRELCELCLTGSYRQRSRHQESLSRRLDTASRGSARRKTGDSRGEYTTEAFCYYLTFLCTQELLDSGADVDAVTELGYTPFHFAVVYGGDPVIILASTELLF